MRTTITLDPDVARMLKQTMRKTGTTFKDTLNSAVRAGLNPRSAKANRKPYSLKGVPLGFRTDILPSHLLEQLEEEDAIRKLREGR